MIKIFVSLKDIKKYCCTVENPFQLYVKKEKNIYRCIAYLSAEPVLGSFVISLHPTYINELKMLVN